jgi:hypothetical protein
MVWSECRSRYQQKRELTTIRQDGSGKSGVKHGHVGTGRHARGDQGQDECLGWEVDNGEMLHLPSKEMLPNMVSSR